MRHNAHALHILRRVQQLRQLAHKLSLTQHGYLMAAFASLIQHALSRLNQILMRRTQQQPGIATCQRLVMQPLIRP